MPKQSCSITIGERLLSFRNVSLSYECANCASSAFVMIELGKAGTVSLSYRRSLTRLSLWRYRHVWVATEGEKLLILCGFCEHVNGECLAFKSLDGTSSIALSCGDLVTSAGY